MIDMKNAKGDCF